MADSTTILDLISTTQAQPATVVNELFDAGSPALLFGRRGSATLGLTWGYFGGALNVAGAPTAIANGTLTLGASATNYIEATAAGVVSSNTSGFTVGRIQLYTAVTGADSVSSYTDKRTPSLGSITYVSYLQNSQSAAYTTVLADRGKHLLHPAADTTARVFTIDSNANVPYPIGTEILFVNEHSAGSLTIAITSDTMRLAGAGTTGSRTLAADGIARALKITATSWIIDGTGLT